MHAAGQPDRPRHRLRPIGNRPDHPGRNPAQDPPYAVASDHRVDVPQSAAGLPCPSRLLRRLAANRNRAIHPAHRRTQPRRARRMQQHQVALAHAKRLLARRPQARPLAQRVIAAAHPAHCVIHGKLNLHHPSRRVPRPPHRDHPPGKDHRRPPRQRLQRVLGASPARLRPPRKPPEPARARRPTPPSASARTKSRPASPFASLPASAVSLFFVRAPRRWVACLISLQACCGLDSQRPTRHEVPSNTVRPAQDHRTKCRREPHEVPRCLGRIDLCSEASYRWIRSR